MSEQPSNDERRATSIKLTVAQLQWVKSKAVERRCTSSDVIEAALIRDGAPPR